jgi:hexosaminidase
MLKIRLFATMVACGMVSVALSGRSSPADDRNAPLSLLPQPLRIERKDGAFVLKKDTKILVEKDSADAANVGKQLAERLNRSTGFDLQVSPSDAKSAVSNAILITLNRKAHALNFEGYDLTVAADGVVITAEGGPGWFYGAQTLLQLLPPEIFSPTESAKGVAWQIPAVRIVDQPRFRWRGLLLDVARHFFNKEEIKSFLDLMAQHKLNTLQLHLTDDQGWRIEIKRYPKLTEIGAWRKDIGFGLNPKDGTAYGPDGRYGGFYTQDDIREIVAYAEARYIALVPEIEMPGHSGAARLAYPECRCKGGPQAFCAGNNETFTFLENVLREVMDLFPGKYIHIGGDEVDKASWKNCPLCQARIKQENLKDEKDLQSYFIKRIERFINSQGRTLIGWDEILEGGLAPNATVMSWRGMDGGIAAANAGHDVVMTPTSHCYFDYLQAKEGEPRGIGGFLPLEQVYSFEPVPQAIPADKAKHILGTGGNLWSEFFPNYAHVQYMAYPRACALAEVAWTSPERKKWEDFEKRLDRHLQRLKVQGVHYRQPRP